MSQGMREISQAAVDIWGLEAQMLMVAEEAVEVAHAIMKWRRAWKRYNKKGISLTRLEEDGILEEKAYARALEKTVDNVRVEAMQMLFMLDQLQVMQPGDYESILEKELMDTRQLLIARGAKL